MSNKELWLFNNEKGLVSHACFCVGPQGDDPVCPCRMPDHRQRQAERAAWEREQTRLADMMKEKVE